MEIYVIMSILSVSCSG